MKILNSLSIILNYMNFHSKIKNFKMNYSLKKRMNIYLQLNVIKIQNQLMEMY
jgi:hypothetical protein